jgi:hypothetical protein
VPDAATTRIPNGRGGIHELWDFERLYDDVMKTEEDRAAA